jgi:hypothetical protein
MQFGFCTLFGYLGGRADLQGALGLFSEVSRKVTDQLVIDLSMKWKEESRTCAPAMGDEEAEKPAENWSYHSYI